jgi:hypothetical protein
VDTKTCEGRYEAYHVNHLYQVHHNGSKRVKKMANEIGTTFAAAQIAAIAIARSSLLFNSSKRDCSSCDGAHSRDPLPYNNQVFDASFL